eukprot:SAG31_NODE_227_length_19818_cov_6.503271_6_plen_176_part_00
MQQLAADTDSSATRLDEQLGVKLCAAAGGLRGGARARHAASIDAMSSVPTTVDIERGSPLEGDRLTLAQQEQLYHDGFVVLKRVVSKELTARARQRIFDPTSEQRDLATGSSPEVLNLINKSPFADVIRNTIGDFDSPTFTQVAITPANTSSNRAYHPTMRNGEAFNLLGHPEEV